MNAAVRAIDSDAQRDFAVAIVRRLRDAGYEALWAGGCVRDQLLGATPKDYDVATSASPEQVRELFGKRKTLAIGAAFGVITVLGRHAQGQIEVATFREDFDYSDGRRPERVVFSHAEVDAQRRDFTINGVFYDPIENRVLDYVGGQEDLNRRVVRAIGNPVERIAEDKLRMLRAVRFAARFDFAIDPATLSAIAAHARELCVVSVERIAVEMRAMLTGPNRGRAWRLLEQTGLLNAVLPEAAESLQAPELLDALDSPTLASALATLLAEQVSVKEGAAVARRWKLSNKDCTRVAWLMEHADALCGAESRRWSLVQPVLAHEGAVELVDLHQARDAVAGELDSLDWVRAKLDQPRELLDPPPLISGDDLLRAGFHSGPRFRDLLAGVRAAQLDGRIADRDEAIALARRIAQTHNAS